MVRVLAPHATLAGLRAAARPDAVFLPALAPFAPGHWALVGMLPVLDINGTLVAALARRRPFRAAPPVAGVFAADPFLRAADLAGVLAGAGIREAVNYPTIQLFEGDTAAAFASVGYRAEAEFRLLLRLAEGGLSPIACALSRDAADLALGLGLRRILLHPGLVAGAPVPRQWAELAGHVAIEGGEPLAWRDPPGAPAPARPPGPAARGSVRIRASGHQSSRPSRRIRL